MAYLFKRPDSVYWQIGYRSKDRNVREATKLRTDDRAATRRAQFLVLEKSKAELATAPTGQRDRWDFWVPGYLNDRCEGKPVSAMRYGLAWRNLSAFLVHRKIFFPAQLSYIDCRDFISFRKNKEHAATRDQVGVLKGHHNTAILELKILNMIMREAVKRGFASSNPSEKLGIGRIAPKEKPEIIDEHLAIIWRELQTEPEWMRVAWQIGFYTGCRLRATRLDLRRDVDVKRRRITFHEKRSQIFEVPMRDELVPLFERLIAAGNIVSCEMPEMPSKAFHTFFHRIGLPQYCFHCTRVTFITRAARAGLQERDVMRLVNHASTTIHRIYLRLRADDLDAPLQKISLTLDPSSKLPESPKTPDSSAANF